MTFWDACRFANWLNNGQPTGVSEDAATDNGTYTLTASGMANNTVTRNAGATWAVTSENEWYKAAYYDPALNGGAGGYYWYATQSNTFPSACAPTGAANCANYNNAVGNTTDVGAYTGSASYYGTFDQNGNVWDWNESGDLRGGAVEDPNVEWLSSSQVFNPSAPYYDTGFRVVELRHCSRTLLHPRSALRHQRDGRTQFASTKAVRPQH